MSTIAGRLQWHPHRTVNTVCKSVLPIANVLQMTYVSISIFPVSFTCRSDVV
jgi:hypothetical protein